MAEFTTGALIILGLCAFVVGLSKTALPGAATLAVALLAAVMPALHWRYAADVARGRRDRDSYVSQESSLANFGAPRARSSGRTRFGRVVLVCGF